MYNKILIRFGELVLKKKNRKMFINQLANNIKHIIGTSPIMEFDRMYLPYSHENMENLNYIFGISSYSPVIESNCELKDFQDSILKLVKNESKTFKIAARRNDKNFNLSSSQLNNVLGSFVLKNTILKVDVNNPDQIFYVEVRKNKTYIFSDYHSALGGLPVGTSGKIIHLLSGGIDSPVAAFKLMKRGLKVDYLSFITPPQTDEKTVSKINRLANTLNKYQVTSTLNLVDYSQIMNYLSLTSNEAYKITLMRRSFYRIAEKIANLHGYLAISNGDNLGQVASQTLESLNVISNVTSIPILRPLLTNDKEETISIAKNIKTYDISVEKANETCELFAPKNPVTKPKKEHAEYLENELDLLLNLEKKIIDDKIEIIKIKNTQ